jgi:MoaA/NifB/PqqE/SkfB family radical SAM enzyme
MDDFSWHIEPTSKCILECPLCDRTWFYEKFKKRLNHEIDIEHLIKFLSGHSGNVMMQGNNGDPIYHSKFLELCLELKKINCKIALTTNGSGKTKDWWKKLSLILSADDSIRFSIDGLEDTNHMYRKNSKWNSIIEAIDVVTKFTFDTTWKFIVLKHNQHQIKDAEEMSKKLGIKNFQLVKSDRWWIQELMPDKEYVNPLYEHQIAVTKGQDVPILIKQKCFNHTNGKPSRGLYIDAEGDFYPCCNMGVYGFRYKTIFSPKHKKFNIRNNTIEQILGDDEVKRFFESTKSYETADKCCKIYCGVKNG